MERKLNWKLFSPQIYGKTFILFGRCFVLSLFLLAWWFSDPKSNIFSFVVILDLFFIFISVIFEVTVWEIYEKWWRQTSKSIEGRRRECCRLVGLWLKLNPELKLDNACDEKQLEWKITWLWISEINFFIISSFEKKSWG